MNSIRNKGPALVAGLLAWAPLAWAGAAGTTSAPPERATSLAAAWPHATGLLDPRQLAAGGRSDRTPPRADPAGSALRVVDEGFAQIDLLHGLFAQGWIRQNNSDHPWLVWQQGDLVNTFLAYDGSPSSYIASHPYSTLANAGTISSWLVTPPIQFGPNTKISFYTRTLLGSQWPTRLQVRACSGACADVGTQPEDVGGFQTLLLDLNPGEAVSTYPEEWTRYQLGVADGLPTSGTGRLAFRHYVHQDDGTLRGDWTGLDRVVVEQDDAADAPLDLELTVAAADPAQPDACGSATSLEIATGDQVNFCYRVTNHTGKTLRYHSLRDNQVGTILDREPIELAPGASHQYNRILTVSESIAPTATWSGQADPPGGYAVDDSQPLDWIDISDGTLSLDGRLAFPADFDFRLFGDRIETLCAGWGALANLRDYYNSCPSLAQFGVRPLPDPALTPYANALAFYETTISAGNVYWKILGSAPNRRFVVAYEDALVAGGDGNPDHGLDAEVILHEGSGVIEFQYANTAFGGQPACAHGGCAGIGLQNKNLAQQYSFYQQSLRNVRRLVWTPSDPDVYARTRQVQILARRAEVSIDPTSIERSAPVGGQAQASVQIANLGDGRLDWHAGTAAANSHLPEKPRFALPLHDAVAAPFAAKPDPNIVGRRGAVPRIGDADATPRGSDDRPLWALDIWGGYLVNGTIDSADYSGVWGGGFDLRGMIGANTYTGADFLDDDFGTLYALDAGNHQLWRIAPVSVVPNVYAQPELIGTLALPSLETPSGLKQDPTSGALYLATSDGNGSRLWSVDPRNATAIQVAVIDGAPGIISIDFDNDGRLYGLDVTQDALYAIDKHTGAAGLVGSLGFSTNGYISALAFDPADDSVAYVAAFGYLDATGREDGSLWRVDKTTGQGSFLHPITGPDGGWSQISAISFAHRGNRCAELAEIPWLHLDQPGGSLQPGDPAATLNLVLDASQLRDGRYEANLCIHSNDPLQLRTALPLTFVVGDPDRIFHDDFDGAAP
ncbi:choice-of-anchor J domain-containing protein [Dokdonella sp.]|uniref:choice-of-anchor J domain-containing protein n=1 Tax=Dokdonella sp. TaxID=2291710 RepID=UPI001B2AD88B|nr:choice-of-anchor J domain-containing protein [Dokdonella sp.]MBO9661360.1 choice-of-anchor J domain-containing protein [Dokdonella sp.]